MQRYHISIILIFFTLIGCATEYPRLEADKVVYERDLVMQISPWDTTQRKYANPFTCDGMCVAPDAFRYEIIVYPPAQTSALVVGSCHRNIEQKNPKSDWWTKGVRYEYEPNFSLEKSSSRRVCSLRVESHNVNSKSGFGLITFDDPEAKLGSIVSCNGSIKSFKGVSVCQAQEGLVQSISFDRPVAVIGTTGCEIKTPVDEMVYNFKIQKKDCIFWFMEKKNPDNYHRLMTFGYEEIPIRPGEVKP